MTNTPFSRKTLSTLDLFRGLPASAQQEALSLARVQRLAPGARIFNQGDGEPRAHLLVEGFVRIAQAGRDGAQIVARFIAPGDMFGTLALFTDRRYPADADALTRAVEVSWSEAVLAGLMKRHQQIAINVIAIVGHRLREAEIRIRELSTQPVEQRIAHSLLRLAAQAGQKTSEGIVLAVPLQRKDIADISGTTLYSASRVLTRWKRAAILSNSGKHLVITKAADIRVIADRGC